MANALYRIVCVLMLMSACRAWAADVPPDYTLAPGDAIKISVFQYPDLTLETRVSEGGTITYPLVGVVRVGGLALADGERRIAKALIDGGFIKQPQVSLVLMQVRGNQISVLGLVNRPGRYPLEIANTRLTEALAMAGGVATGGADTAILAGLRGGKAYREEVDIPALFLDARQGKDIAVMGGDTIYVHRAPVFYIYGEVQRPGVYRLERGMTIMQGLAQGGGPTLRGSEKSLKVMRRVKGGDIEPFSPAKSDPLLADDVIYVPESLF